MMTREINVSVIGGGNATVEILQSARKAGELIAANGWTLVCGGLGGVMEAAAQGAAEKGGLTVGILPGYNLNDANPHIKIVIPTGMGHARNTIVAASGDAVLAIGGEYGTLSEIALALKMGKPVIGLHTNFASVQGVISASSAVEAIELIRDRLA